MNTNLIDVKNLKKYFPVNQTNLFSTQKQFVKAVDDISFAIQSGETMGFVGESGCGKSTVGRTILRLIEPTEGQVIFEGRDILKLNPNDLRDMRKEMQIIFQDPYASLDPRKTVKEIVGEAFHIHKIGTSKEIESQVKELLRLVGMGPDHINRYPHEFSGGQRQRIGIARALALNPKFVVCDEPVSALDVSIQAQVVNLMKDLQQKLGLTYLFISHDLRIVKHICNRISVMYLGTLVEIADKADLYSNPLHPYTQALLSAIPTTNPNAKRQRIILEGDVPSPMNPPSGCRFHTRCPEAKEICKLKAPELRDLGTNHMVACHMR
ncbi:MAG: dipeptide ABC transporter ATP-binding protein [Chloroflexi bacterium]|nr:dipeptide ABC transporter ATP-binding protein [Chloroflexota bacterium]